MNQRWGFLASHLLVVSGAVLLGYCALQWGEARWFQYRTERSLERTRAGGGGSETPSTTRLDAGSEWRIGADSAGDLPDTDVGPGPGPEWLGRIEIARVDMSSMILPDTGKESLKRGVGHIAGTAKLNTSGNCGLAGHRDTFFRRLRLVAVGDTIAVTTPEATWRYRVTATRIVAPSEVGVLAPTPEARLTLVTCYPFNVLGRAPKRYIVEAETLEPAGGFAAADVAGAMHVTRRAHDGTL